MKYEKKYRGKHSLAIRVPQSEALGHEDDVSGAVSIVGMTMSQLAEWLEYYGYKEIAEDLNSKSEEIIYCMQSKDNEEEN